MAIVGIGLPVIAILIITMGWIAYWSLTRISHKEEAFILAWGKERGDILPGDLDLPWLREEIGLPDGGRIVLHALDAGQGKLVIIQHGITWSWLGMLRYARLFISLGWTVVLPDSRGHGETRHVNPGLRRAPSYGAYEALELKAVADWACGRFPYDKGFVAFGLSMGAASILQYAPIDGRLDAAIADCPFTNAAEEVAHRLRRGFVPFFLIPAIVRIADGLCRWREGFSLYDASPERAALSTGIPLLFIHGLEDDYVPWKMSVAMVDERKRTLPLSRTELLLVPGAKHGRSAAAQPELYLGELRAFLGELVPGVRHER